MHTSIHRKQSAEKTQEVNRAIKKPSFNPQPTKSYTQCSKPKPNPSLSLKVDNSLCLQSLSLSHIYEICIFFIVFYNFYFSKEKMKRCLWRFKWKKREKAPPLGSAHIPAGKWTTASICAEKVWMSRWELNIENLRVLAIFSFLQFGNHTIYPDSWNIILHLLTFINSRICLILVTLINVHGF